MSISRNRVYSLRACITFAYLVVSLVVFVQGVKAETLQELASGQIVGNVEFEQQLNIAAEVGMGRVRFGIRWYEVEKRPGVFDWRKSDAQLAMLKSRGIAPIITLFGGNELYQASTTKQERTAPSTERAYSAFSRFASGVVKRYGNTLSDKQIYYEIWNEPNTKTFWRPMPNPENYAALASSACEAIKTVDQDAIVLGLPMEGTPVKQPYYVKEYGIDIYQEWARRAATPKLMECVDGIAMHPYRKSPESYLDDEASLQTYLSTFWKKNGKPLILNTEWGYSSSGAEGEERQALNTVRAFLVGASLHRITNIYQLSDGGRDTAKENENYGLSTFKGEIKASGYALQRLLKEIGGYVPGPIERPSENVAIASFVNGSEKAWVAWSTGPGSAPLPSWTLNRENEAINVITGEKITLPRDLRDVGPTPILILGKN